jgi:hopanoid biosynthesis associated protein HpnK
MKHLIVTGDDFGLAVPVNEAVELAHRDGILSAASLMVGAGAAADAVERARRLPRLRVGLHVTVVEGRPVLPPEQIPDLVTASGGFRDELVSSGFRFFLLPGIRIQLEAEIRAQFQAFRNTGLALDHVNAHNHMHLHPTVLNIILKVGREFGMGAMRLPWEPPLRAWRLSRSRLWSRLLAAAGLAPWIAFMRWRLRSAGIAANDCLFGLSESGQMHEALLADLLGALPDGATELYFHPATRRCPEIDRTMSGYRHEQELAALLSPRVKSRLDELGLEPGGYLDLPAGRQRADV